MNKNGTNFSCEIENIAILCLSHTARRGDAPTDGDVAIPWMGPSSEHTERKVTLPIPIPGNERNATTAPRSVPRRIHPRNWHANLLKWVVILHIRNNYYTAGNFFCATRFQEVRHRNRGKWTWKHVANTRIPFKCDDRAIVIQNLMGISSQFKFNLKPDSMKEMTKKPF